MEQSYLSGPEELFFFDDRPDALPLYEALRAALLEIVPDARIQVKKTQISFFTRYMFAAVSFAPVRRTKDRPKPYLTLSFGLAAPLDSPRLDAAVEVRPHRWTHHITLGRPGDVDEELLTWLRAAADFAGRA